MKPGAGLFSNKALKQCSICSPSWLSAKRALPVAEFPGSREGVTSGDLLQLDFAIHFPTPTRGLLFAGFETAQLSH